jgi:hypothetical protein
MSVDEIRKTAAEIIFVFEEYLHRKGVAVENREHEEEGSEAIICGRDYYELEELSPKV